MYRLLTLPYKKGKTRQATQLVKVQSVLCKEAGCLKRVIVFWRCLLQIFFEHCLVNVIVYEKDVHREIRDEENVVICIIVVRIIRDFN